MDKKNWKSEKGRWSRIFHMLICDDFEINKSNL